jgi:hypothetical protein
MSDEIVGYALEDIPAGGTGRIVLAGTEPRTLRNRARWWVSRRRYEARKLRRALWWHVGLWPERLIDLTRDVAIGGRDKQYFCWPSTNSKLNKVHNAYLNVLRWLNEPGRPLERYCWASLVMFWLAYYGFEDVRYCDGCNYCGRMCRHPCPRGDCDHCQDEGDWGHGSGAML